MTSRHAAAALVMSSHLGMSVEALTRQIHCTTPHRANSTRTGTRPLRRNGLKLMRGCHITDLRFYCAPAGATLVKDAESCGEAPIRDGIERSTGIVEYAV